LNELDVKVSDFDSGEDFCLPNKTGTISDSEVEEIDHVLQPAPSRASVEHEVVMTWIRQVSCLIAGV
jgi:hypothetical protein